MIILFVNRNTKIKKSRHLVNILVCIYNKFIFWDLRILLQPHNMLILQRKTFYVLFEAKLAF